MAAPAGSTWTLLVRSDLDRSDRAVEKTVVACDTWENALEIIYGHLGAAALLPGSPSATSIARGTHRFSHQFAEISLTVPRLDVDAYSVAHGRASRPAPARKTSDRRSARYNRLSKARISGAEAQASFNS